jgi:hypothetical protein
MTKVHLAMDNLRMHTGKQVQAWLATHTCFKFHHPPGHCSWMNQVEQWFSILQPKRLAIADFADEAALVERLKAFVQEGNVHAHPFKWTTKSVAKNHDQLRNPVTSSSAKIVSPFAERSI